MALSGGSVLVAQDAPEALPTVHHTGPAPDLGARVDPALAEFFFEDLVLGAEVLDDVLLLAVAPTGQDGEQELPGPENDIHG